MDPEKSEIVKQIVAIVGEENVSADSEDMVPYVKDSYTLLLKKEIPLPDFVVLPESTDQVQGLIRLANENKIPVYPRSFGINIAGSAIPYAGGMVMDLKRMDRILEINADTMTATIEPGVNWGKLRKEANKKGLDIIPILGPYQTSPVGNFLLTNITPYSSKYNPDRAVTFEAVLPNGEILRTGSQCTELGADLNPYFRYAYGPDIAGLFRGSLGNFGTITRFVTRLRPMAEEEKILIFGFDRIEDLLAAIQRIERMEFTRSCTAMNRYMNLHVLLSPARMKEAAQREKILAMSPPYAVSFGVGGIPKQVALYAQMLAEEAARFNGTLFELEEQYRPDWNEAFEGCSQKALRMFAPFGGFAAVIGCVPFSRVPDIHRVVLEIVKKYNLTDPLSGGPLTPELILVPYDRGSTVYVEHELLYDPLDTEAVTRVNQALRECYSRIMTEYGAVHTIPNRTLLKLMLPAYADLLRGIKGLVDPNGIFMPDGPYSF